MYLYHNGKVQIHRPTLLVLYTQRLEENEKLLKGVLEETEKDLQSITEKYIQVAPKAKVTLFRLCIWSVTRENSAQTYKILCDIAVPLSGFGERTASTTGGENQVEAGS